MSTHRHIQFNAMLCVFASVALAALVALFAAGSALAAGQGPSSAKPPSRTVGAAEKARLKGLSIKRIARSAKPLPTPRTMGRSLPDRRAPNGPSLRIRGTRPQSAAASGSSASSVSTAAAAAAQNGLWPGSYAANPNRQVGKLFFWTGTRWSHCAATAINSENKSLVLTAGHCVYNPDPDQNGYVGGNGQWYSDVYFCPGYEYGCKLGRWNARQIYTTNSWFYGSGTYRQYDWRDDIAVVLVSPNTQGNLVNVTGGQGIGFNQSVNQYRFSFGYPVSDPRWPEYSYSGQDLDWCPGRDGYDGAGHLFIACTMTGGASGGPWLTNVSSSWLGTVNGVNSHKAWGGAYMGSPYFDSTESWLFQYARAR
jgi:hypothetical protein